MKHRFRQSEISAWQRCRRKHHFRYERGLVPVAVGPRRPASSHRDAGSAAHKGIEVLNEGGTLEQAEAAIDEFIDELRSIRNDAPLEDIVLDKEWWEVWRLANSMIRNYVVWIEEGNEVGVKVIATEQSFDVVIPGTDYEVFGQIDALVEDPIAGGLVVRDYKSVQNFSQTPMDVDFQLRTYAWATWRSLGIVPVQAEHLMMKRVLGTGRAKPPFFERFPIHITEQILQTHEKHLIGRCAEIYAHRDLPAHSPLMWPNPTKDCSWDCDYRDVCPMVDDGSDYEDVLQSSFGSIDES